MIESLKTSDPEVIALCLKKRYSGVSASMNALMPKLAEKIRLMYVGAPLPNAKQPCCLWQAIQCSFKPLADGRYRIWHLRRNKEMLLGIVLRDLCRLPIRLVFTSAAIRRHSLFPRLLISKMDYVIATSPRSAGFIHNKSSVVLHGVNNERFSCPNAALQSAETLLAAKTAAWQESHLPGRYGIGCYGRVRHEKGVHLFVGAMIELLPKSPDFCAFIAGLTKPKDQGYRNMLQQKIQQCGLRDRIIFLGNIDAEEIPIWYQRSLITVACPLYEGFGLTALEGMAAATAVVASRTGAFDTLITNNQNGLLVNVNQQDALTQALKVLLNSPRATAQIGLTAQRTAAAHYSIQNEVKGIIAAYHTVWQSQTNKTCTQ